MTDLAARYGTGRGPSRALILVVTSVIVSLGALLTWTAVSYSSPSVNSALIGFKVENDNLATAQILVKRADQGVIAVCAIKAVAEDFGLVGVQQLVVDSGPLEQRIDLEIRTERRATSISTEGCTTQGQPRPR